MRIIIDADACPALQEIALIANTNNLECHLFCDHSHNLDIDNTIIHYISQGFQMVDIAISNFIKKEDILITQDYGLALIALSKGAYAINPSEMVYDSTNIDNLLEQKFINQKLRDRHIKTTKTKKRTNEINQKFLNNLQNLINFTKNS